MAQNQTQTNQTPQIYAYTQHVQTIRVIEEVCGQKIVMLEQDRTRDPVEDVLRQLPQEVLAKGATLYAVVPVDKAVELKQRMPQLKVRLMQLDGKVVEKLTGRPYDPKTEYPREIVMQALKIVEIRGGYIRYLNVDNFLRELNGKKVAVFNDTLREALNIILNKRTSVAVELVKTCDSGNCVEVNPLGTKSGYRVSFPGTVGKLTPEQMAEMIERDEARIYYAEVIAEETSLCA